MQLQNDMFALVTRAYTVFFIIALKKETGKKLSTQNAKKLSTHVIAKFLIKKAVYMQINVNFMIHCLLL